MPAFSGLFAPYWKGNARGVFAGLTRYVNNGHIARATLEATAFQSREVSDAMNADSGVELESLKVDGGMVVNETLMQFQADILGVPVIRPQVAETTALGAAYAAGFSFATATVAAVPAGVHGHLERRIRFEAHAVHTGAVDTLPAHPHEVAQPLNATPRTRPSRPPSGSQRRTYPPTCRPAGTNERG